MFFCLLFPKKRALFENKTPISRQKRAGPKRQRRIGREQITPCRFYASNAPEILLHVVLLISQSIPNGPPRTPAPTRQTIARKRGRLIAAPTAISDNKQRRSWAQMVTKQAPGAEASCARRRICFRLGGSMAQASRSLVGAIHESPVSCIMPQTHRRKQASFFIQWRSMIAPFTMQILRRNTTGSALWHRFRSQGRPSKYSIFEHLRNIYRTS